MAQGTVIQYKCPNCGADMMFDAASGNLKCGSCGRTDSIKNSQSNGEFRPSQDHSYVQSTTTVQDDMVQGDAAQVGLWYGQKKASIKLASFFARKRT